MHCVTFAGPQGSMFAYPRVDIPKAAQAAAEKHHLTPDEFYCLRLLEETGTVQTFYIVLIVCD